MVTEIRTVVTSGRVVLTGKEYNGAFRDAGNILDLDFSGRCIQMYKFI